VSSTDRQSPFFRAWTRFVIRWRWPLLLLTFAVTAVFQVQMKRHLRFDSSVEYFAAGSKAREVLEEFQEDFGNDTYHVVLVEGDVFSLPFLEQLQGLHDHVAQFDPDGSSTPAPGDAAPVDEWGEGDDDAGFGDPADDDGWGEGDDDAGFGDDDGWGEGDDDAGFGDAPDQAEPATARSQAGVIEEIVSLINVRQTVFEGGAVRVRGLLDGGLPTADELPALRDQVLGDPTLAGYVVGDDGSHAIVILRTTAVDFEGRSAIYRALKDQVQQFDAADFKVSVTGMPALNAELVTTMQADMRRLIAGAFVVMALVLGWLFRRPVGIIAPLIVVAMAAIWTLGSMATFRVPVTLLTNIVPAFLACVGLGDSIHVIAVYRDERKSGLGQHDAIVAAIGSTGTPLLFTTLTTAVGLLSFRFAKMDAIAEMGSYAAFGVVVALLHSVTFLPIALSLASDKAFASTTDTGVRKRDWIDGLLARATAVSAIRGPVPVLVAGLVVVLVAAVGISRINVYHNPVDWMPEAYPARVALEELDQEVGGTAQVNVVLDAAGDRGIRDLALLQGMQELEQHIRDFEHPATGDTIVTGTSSVLDIVKETNRALNDGAPDAYRLPDTQRGVSDILLLFESAAPQDLRRLATADLAKSHITVRLKWMDATSYQPFTHWIDQGIHEHIADFAEARPTGSVYELVTTVGGLIGDLLRSFGAALVSVTLMMILLLRSPTLGLIAMIPNLVPVALVMGFMGYAGIPLDLTNLLIASIVIGVAVDNTVHYMFQWKAAYRSGADTDAAIQHALDHAGRALVGTAMILALGFGVYLLSAMSNIRFFGMLVGSACVFALFTNLIFAPSLLRLLFRDRA